MLWLPMASALVLHAAVLVLPLPASATALHPASTLPPLAKATVPVGLLPVTVAVKVTLAPMVAGLAELASVVVTRGGAETVMYLLLVLVLLPPGPVTVSATVYTPAAA